MIKDLIKLKLFISMCILFFVDHNAYCQSFTKVTTINLPELNKGSATWADMDNDGDLDFLLKGEISFGDNRCEFYMNNGDETFTMKRKASIYGSARSNVAWLDYDNDGFLDFVMQNSRERYNNQSLLYVNDGSGDFEPLANIEFNDFWYGSVNRIDVNNDGLQDITTSTSSTKLYVNNKSNGFEEVTDTSFNELAYDRQVAWGDYDNDGYVDMIGTSGGMHPKTQLFRNNGNNTFSPVSTNIINLQHGMSAWGDYDNDGDLDILITGYDRSYKTKLYRNNGNGSFSQQNITFEGVQQGRVVWGDYNNDGFLDVVVSGMTYANPKRTKIYKNNGNNTFSELTDIQIPQSVNGSTNFGDYDNDGDLDLLFAGYRTTTLYKNNTPNSNNPPSAPTNLKAEGEENQVNLSWSAPTDDTTPSVALSYSVRVGTTPGGTDIVSPMSLPNGYRQLPEMGNAELGTFFILKGLTPGTYYWSVQAVDNSYAGGAFAEEKSFTVTATAVEYNFSKGIRVVSEPEFGRIRVECNAFNKVELYSIQGKLIQRSTDKNLSLGDLKHGIYILKILDLNHRCFTQKIVY